MSDTLTPNEQLLKLKEDEVIAAYNKYIALDSRLRELRSAIDTRTAMATNPDVQAMISDLLIRNGAGEELVKAVLADNQ